MASCGGVLLCVGRLYVLGVWWTILWVYDGYGGGLWVLVCLCVICVCC